MLGEPAYDLAIHLHNRIHLDPDPVARVSRLAGRLSIPPRRAQLWLAAKLTQLCSWYEDTGQPAEAGRGRPRLATSSTPFAILKKILDFWSALPS